jgi:hypothetical protein
MEHSPPEAENCSGGHKIHPPPRNKKSEGSLSYSQKPTNATYPEKSIAECFKKEFNE